MISTTISGGEGNVILTKLAHRLSPTMFANVVCTEEYQAQLKKAREEYNRIISGSGTRIEAPSADATTRTAAIYDMNGRQLNEKPNNGVYIQSGQKFISK